MPTPGNMLLINLLTGTPLENNHLAGSGQPQQHSTGIPFLLSRIHNGIPRHQQKVQVDCGTQKDVTSTSLSSRLGNHGQNVGNELTLMQSIDPTPNNNQCLFGLLNLFSKWAINAVLHRDALPHLFFPCFWDRETQWETFSPRPSFGETILGLGGTFPKK